MTSRFLDTPRRRRIFQRLLLLSIILLAIGGGVLAHDCLVYIGTYTNTGSEGIYAFRFDPDTGGSVQLGLAAATDNPSFLAVDPTGRFLYAVNEPVAFHGEPAGSVSVFGVDRESGRLNQLQKVPSLGVEPAYLSLDKSARFLMVANYDVGNFSGGNVAVFPIGRDGRLGPHSALVRESGSSINPERQAGPHPHFIQATNDNRFVLVADLGLDKLLVYRFDPGTGSLTPGNPGYFRADPGSGPRHIAFAPSGKFVYVVNELASTVTVLAYESGSGILSRKQTVSTLPKTFAGKNKAAEIAVDSRGRFLYVSNRGDDSLIVFGIDPDNGTLRLVERVASGGRTPRSFALDPSGQWLLVGNQDSNSVQLFRIEPGSGRLIATHLSLKVVSPVCVCPVPLQ